MAEPAKKSSGWTKALVIGMLGVGGGAAGTYATAVVDRVVKPTKPVANFAASADGLTLTCQNHASGESGWWDFGDGTALEPFKADGQAVTHAYAKPGTYTVKLTVRNYFSEENERAVPVEVATGAKEAPVPAVTGFALLPVSGSSVAPATFRLTAEVKNADAWVCDFGDGRLDVADGGKIDRMVTFDKPGAYGVTLVAHNGKVAVKHAATVKVDAPAEGTTMAVLKVTDAGTRVDRVNLTETVVIPVPNEKKAAFSKVVAARPGFTIAQATPPAAVNGAKNVKVDVAADKRSMTVSGEWAADPKVSNKAAGGSDVIVPLKVVEERARPMAAAVTLVTGALVGGRAELPLPPTPDGVTGGSREFQIEIRATAGGKSATVVQGGAVKLPWSGADARGTKYAAKLDGDRVVVTAGK